MLPRAAILAVILVTGCAISVFLYTELSKNEHETAEHAFQGAFSTVVGSFVSFLTNQLVCVVSLRRSSLENHRLVSLPSKDDVVELAFLCHS